MSSRGLSLRRITGHCTVASDRVTAWYQLAPQGWSFRPDNARERLVVDTADALAQLTKRNLCLRVTTRPCPVSRWAQAHDANAPAPLPGWPEHLIRDQVQLASRSMADKEVYLGVDLGTSRRVLHALSGLVGRAADREVAAMAKPMTPAQIREWLDILDADDFARRHDLPELARFILATGLRLGEALGVRWSDIDPDRGSLRVERTIVRVKGKGLVASRPKTHSSQRVLVLPGWCLTMLQARRARLGVTGGPVFPDSLGGYRDRNNVGAAFRRVRTGTGFEWVTPHTFRKTVATLLDSKGASARMIADQLGHSRVSMTQDVYMGRRAVPAELAEALESLDDHQRPQPRRRDWQ
jgi:integrase